MSRFNNDDPGPMFSVFYRAHYVAAVGLAHWRAPGCDAEAIVAEAFLAAWQHAVGGGEVTRPWFFRTLRNKIGDYYRSHQRRESCVSDLVQVGMDQAVDGDEEIIVQRMMIYGLLNDLPSSQAEALALVYGCDLTSTEAAGVLGVRDTTFRKRLERARAAFAAKLSTVTKATAEEEN